MNYTDDFTPTNVVTSMHDVPHYNFQGQLVDSSFNITYTNVEYTNEYIQSILYVPFVIFIWLFIILCGWWIALCCRFCFKCCNCGPTYDTDSIRQVSLLKKYFGSIRYLTRSFVILIIVVIIMDQLIFLGSGNLSNGYHQGSNTLNFFYNTFNSLANDGIALQQEGYIITSDVEIMVTSGTCVAAAPILEYTKAYNEDISNYLSEINPMTSDISTYQDFYKLVFLQLKNIVIYSFYGSVWLFVLWLSAGVYFQSKCTLQWAMFVISTLLISIWFTCAGEMSFLVRI